MTNEALKHLDKAAKLIVKGDSFYAQAADEIRAAQKEDPTLGNREIGKIIGERVRGKAYSETWVRDVVNNLGAGSAVGWRRGSHGTTAEIQAGARKILAEAPVEQVEEILDTLPPERKAELRLHLNVTADRTEHPKGRTISEITGSGPVYEAIQKLAHARREIMGVPAKLAVSGVLGNEANFPQFRRELERLKNAIVYLDRYLADETVIDGDALDDALAKILAGEEV
jgi:hypothetical protein